MHVENAARHIPHAFHLQTIMSESAAAIETMSADFALRQPDSLDQHFHRIEFQGSQPETFLYDIDHPVVFRSTHSGILVQIFAVIAFQFLYYAACDKLHCTLGRSKADKFTRVDQRRTSYADVHLFRSVIIKDLHIVAQLGAAHNRIITESRRLPSSSARLGISFILATSERMFWLLGIKLLGQVGVYFAIAL